MNELKFSASRFNVMKKCLGQYYFKYIKKIEVERILWPATVGGSTMHLFIENNLNKIESVKKIKPEKQFSDLFIEVRKEELSKDKKLKFKESRGYNEEDYLKEMNKWSLDILRFLYLYLPKGINKFEEEVNEEFIIGENKLKINAYIDLQIQLDDANIIFDFKTTKEMDHYYFVDWSKDIQSLLYLFLKRESNVSGFSYLVFDKQDKMMLTTSRLEFTKEDEKNMFSIFSKFIELHNKVEDVKAWSPSKENCKYCEFKKYCKVKYE